MATMTDTPMQPSGQSALATNPDYELKVEAEPKRMRVVFNGETIADSTKTLLLHETRLPDYHYFPRADVRMEFLRRTDHHTFCPYKGNASYWSIEVGDETMENGAWSYEEPYEEASEINGYISFYLDRGGTLFAGDENSELEAHQSPPAHSNPFAEWLLREAWEALSSRELLARLCRCLIEAGVPVSRSSLLIRTLHPQLFATVYHWDKKSGTVDKWEGTHAEIEEEKFRNSPFATILEGAGGVRRRLEGPNPNLDYPILKDLHAEGATDYVAMPITFSSGQVNILTLTSDAPGGFSTNDLGRIHEILPILSRLLEVHAMHRTNATLLHTFLGKHTGELVRRGLVKRGDGERIHAVIWFYDLRGSTPLAESMSTEVLLVLLNKFFDCMAGAVIDNGGEVLRFIDDAVLAIFPTGETDRFGDSFCNTEAEACDTALFAARDARRRVEELNVNLAKSGQQPIQFGIGVHLGDVMYCNIGVPERLEFTVIGAAANEAARIESMCKVLDQSILLSAEVAEKYSGELQSLGCHALRGVSAEQEIFTLSNETGGETAEA